MKSRFSQYSHLPNIQKASLDHNQKGKSLHERKSGFMSPKYKLRQSQIFKLLKQVRKNMQSSLQNQQTIENKTKKKEEKIKKKQSCLVKKQRKIYYMQTQPSQQNKLQPSRKLTNFVSNSVQVQQIQSLEKPPHRTKMAMCIQGDNLYLYGGLGCQPNLRLAVFDVHSKKLTFPQHQNFAQYHPTTPLIGHTFGCYKGKGYIYGGSSNDVINQLTIVNFKTLKYTQGQHCQYRRKNHAMIMISKFIIIHGGLSANQVCNTMYFYNTETNQWTYPTASIKLPFLASHGMASTFPFKTKKKQIFSLNQLQDPIFLFGGQDKSGNMCNNLYKVMFEKDTFIATEIQLFNAPSKRTQMCFQYVGSNTILLYGGKLETFNEKESSQDELSSQIYSFNTENQQWTHLSTMDIWHDRYGMASTSLNGKVYIFGGFIGNKYANADITTLSIWNYDIKKSKSNFGTKVFSCQKYC